MLGTIPKTVNCSSDQFLPVPVSPSINSNFSSGGDPDPFLNLAHTRAESNQAIAGRKEVAPGNDSTTIQGFTTSISTPVGGTVNFNARQFFPSSADTSVPFGPTVIHVFEVTS